jgi:hypothetical protein
MISGAESGGIPGGKRDVLTAGVYSGGVSGVHQVGGQVEREVLTTLV